MTNRKIKVVKRDAPPLVSPDISPQPRANPDRGISNTIKDWISESRENRRSEKAASDNAVFGWQQIPDTNAG
jgi:hypothetical protein